MEIDIVVLGRVVLALALLGAGAGWFMARSRGLNRMAVSLTALVLGLLPPLNLLYLLYIRSRRCASRK